MIFSNMISAQEDKSVQFKKPNKVYYINLRDFIDITSAFSLGIHMPMRTRKIIDSQIGFINPYTYLFAYNRFQRSSSGFNNGYDFIIINKYGGKLSEEIKFLYGSNDKNPNFHGLQFTYQYEQSEAELNYRRFHQYNQLLPTKWKFQTISLFYKFGELIYFSTAKMMIEIAIGAGIEYKQDINSVYTEFKDAELIRRNSFFNENIPRNDKSFYPNFVLSFKLGIY